MSKNYRGAALLNECERESLEYMAEANRDADGSMALAAFVVWSSSMMLIAIAGTVTWIWSA